MRVCGIKFKTNIYKKMFKIRIVGFKFDLTVEEFTSKLFHNDFLSLYNTSEHFEILKIKSCHRDNTNFQAVLIVSEDFRTLLKKYSDRVLIECYSCQGYDNVNVMRCFKCQAFGHLVKNCSNGKSMIYFGG